MNTVCLSGRLTADPELKTTRSGLSVCHVTLAVPDGREKTHFVPITAWRERAEFLAKNFAKGQRAEVEGKLVSEEWTDRDGKKHTRWEIVAREVHFGESKRADAAERPLPSAAPGEDEFEEITADEDLPF